MSLLLTPGSFFGLEAGQVQALYAYGMQPNKQAYHWIHWVKHIQTKLNEYIFFPNTYISKNIFNTFYVYLIVYML